MSLTSRILTVFSYYLIIAGLTFLIQPGFLFVIIPQPDSTTWLSLIGILLIVLALYYHGIAAIDDDSLHRLTNYSRLGVLVAIIALIIAERIEPIFILFGLVDAVFALVSFITLKRKDK